MKPIKQLTNIELWELISKEYVGTPEIEKIGFMGTSTAQNLRKEIEKELSGWLLPKHLVPTDKVLDKLNINRNDIFRKAKMERELL